MDDFSSASNKRKRRRGRKLKASPPSPDRSSPSPAPAPAAAGRRGRKPRRHEAPADADAARPPSPPRRGEPKPVADGGDAVAVAVSEAAIAALVAAEAPADDYCAVCLQDGAAPAAWSRVAPCGHRFHAACVEKWLRVKPSCPVCRRPAAPSPPAAVPGAMN